MLHIKGIYLWIFLCFLVISLIPTPSIADIHAGSGEIGLSFGGLLYDEDVRDEAGSFARLGMGLNFTERFGVELAILNSLDSTDDVPDSTFYTIGAVTHFIPDSDLNPYLLLGFGSGTFNTRAIDNENRYVIDGGLGLRYALNNDFTLKVDVRDYMTLDDVTHNFAASIGIVAVFDVFAPSKQGPAHMGDEGDRVPVAQEEEEGSEREEEPAARDEGRAVSVTGEEPPSGAVERGVEKPADISAYPTEKEAVTPFHVAGEVMVPAAAEVVEEPQVTAADRPQVNGAEVIPDEEAPPRVKERPDYVIPEEGEGPVLDEDYPEHQLVVLHKGAQILIHFPEKSAGLDGELFQVIMQLIAYLKERPVRDVRIVSYSYDFRDPAGNTEISDRRVIALKQFLTEHSAIPAEKIRLLARDRKTFVRFREEAREDGDINKAFIMVSFE